MLRYCLALDLKDDPKLIAEYEAYHKKVWPEIIDSIKNSGIEILDIYRTGNRMFMIIEVIMILALRRKLQWMRQIRKCRNGKN